MELRHLRYFVAVAEELHFGRAAARLGLAQPPLSQQIRQLEGELGLMLLRRTNRRVALTDAGWIFLEESRQVLARVDRAADLARQAARGAAGRIAIGFVGSATYETVPRVLRRYRERFPAVEIALRQLTTAEQVGALRDGGIQVGFLRPPVAADDLDIETIRREPFVVALPEGHPLAGGGRVPLAALRDESFVTYPRRFGPGLYDRTMILCARAGFTPRIVQEAVEMQTIVGLVAGGIGLALVPAAVRALRNEGVIYKDLRGLTPYVELAVAWRRDDPSTVLGAFLDLVREAR